MCTFLKTAHLWVLCSFLFTLCSVSSGPLFAAKKQRSSDHDSVYEFKWLDPDKKVYILQNKEFKKNKKIYGAIGGGITFSQAFVNSKNVQIRFGYFFTENFGVEALFSANKGEPNSTDESVRRQGVVPFKRVVKNYYSISLTWAPFYGKLNTFNQIIYYDWIFGLGLGQLTEENNKGQLDANAGSGLLDEEESHLTFVGDIAFRFYLTRSFDIRIDIVPTYYRARVAVANAPESQKRFYYNWDLNLSFGFTF